MMNEHIRPWFWYLAIFLCLVGMAAACKKSPSHDGRASSHDDVVMEAAKAAIVGVWDVNPAEAPDGEPIDAGDQAFLRAIAQPFEATVTIEKDGRYLVQPGPGYRDAKAIEGQWRIEDVELRQFRVMFTPDQEQKAQSILVEPQENHRLRIVVDDQSMIWREHQTP